MPFVTWSRSAPSAGSFLPFDGSALTSPVREVSEYMPVSTETRLKLDGPSRALPELKRSLRIYERHAV